MNKEYKKLDEKNNNLRDELNEIFDGLGLEKGNERDTLWDKINELIEIELEQEELCNE